jgi:hypothetical protein
VFYLHITQGDNNVIITFFGQSKRTDVITGSTITVSINRAGVDVITKQATIINNSTGQCSFTLTSSDLTYAGTYEYQWTVTLPGGNSFTGGPAYFYVASSNNPNYNTGTTIEPVTVQVASLVAQIATLTSLTPESSAIALNGVTVGNFYLPRNQVTLGTITLA